MQIKSKGISEAVLEVKNMDMAVEFWHKKLGFPIVDRWGYQNGQFSNSEEADIWATWLYVGGNTRLGLWLPREFDLDQLNEKNEPVSKWNGLFDEGGLHVHLAFFIDFVDIDDALNSLDYNRIDYKIIINPADHRRIYFKDTENNVIEFYTLNMHEDYLLRLREGLMTAAN